VSLPPLAFAAPMCSAQDDAALPASGFPIRRSAGQRLFSASPRLIAAVHVLHRLLVPRHPPHALSILTVIRPDGLRRPCVHDSRPCGRPAWIDNSILWPYCAVFKVRREAPEHCPTGSAGLSKLNSMRARRPLPDWSTFQVRAFGARKLHRRRP
jgi:hypothetical protein